jgi:hypothetical protein
MHAAAGRRGGSLLHEYGCAGVTNNCVNNCQPSSLESVPDAQSVLTAPRAAQRGVPGRPRGATQSARKASLGGVSMVHTSLLLHDFLSERVVHLPHN